MIKDLLKYGLGASVTALFCCVAPAILFAVGIGSGIFAFQFADFFYNADGSANAYAWILRAIGALVILYGIIQYNKKESCSINTKKQKMINKILFAGILISFGLGLYFAFTELTTSYFETIDVQRQIEFKS